MATFKVCNAARMNIVGFVQWENNKNYNELMALLVQEGYVKNPEDYYLKVEDYGMSFSINDRKLYREVLFLSLYVEPIPDLSQ